MESVVELPAVVRDRVPSLAGVPDEPSGDKLAEIGLGGGPTASGSDGYDRPMKSSEIPQVPEEHLEKLKPLTARELGRCIVEATNDRFDHLRSRHPSERVGNTTKLQHVLDKLLENPDYAAAVARSTGLASEPKDLGAPEGYDVLEALRRAASNAVSQYWSHVTEGHIAPDESEKEYLQRLVERIPREPA